jgi:butyryl-CoA dehydrogenase
MLLGEITEEQLELKRIAKEAGTHFRPQAQEWDRTDNADLEAVTAKMAEFGLTGLTMPVEYGGKGRTVLDYVLAVEEVARAATSSIPVEAMFRTSGPGPSLLLLAENEDVRRRFLPRVVSGSTGAALTVSEPTHGSDVTHLETTARRDGDHYVLNGAKKYITGAGVDKLYATFVRFDDIPGAKGVGGIVVEAGTPGLRIECKTKVIGSRGMPHGELYFEECRVPAAHLLGGPGSFARLMLGFNMERMHNAALATGRAEAAFDLARARVLERKSFGRPIVEFQAVYHALADMHVQIEAARQLVYAAARAAKEGTFPEPLSVTTAKYFANGVLFEVASKSLELHGAYGTQLDADIQRIVRDSMTSRVAGGAPNIARNVIAAQILPEVRLRQEA